MLFNSLEFLLFLPIVFLLYWFVFRGRRWQNLLVVIASYVFYGWWDYRFLLLIAFTSLCSFTSGLLLEHYEGRRSIQQVVSTANIMLNLGVLGLFKYYNFFVENLDALLGMMHLRIDWVTMNVILPVGISFYTFQALSYTIDIYQKRLRATHDIVEFFAYISFFPQLVAGPIERATNLLPQFQRERRFDYAQAVDGMRQMLWGFFKKMVVADNCAVAVNYIWTNYSESTGLTLLIGGMLFAFQIYGDFSGYSDIAIGCARLFGMNLMRNFNYPYFARNIADFWRRWHISLTTWFRDYIYFPLGGSHCGRWRRVRNVFVVWGVSGLWHGANWTFVCWGLYHGLLLSAYRYLHDTTCHPAHDTGRQWLRCAKATAQALLTFILVVFGWVLFRAETLGDAIGYIFGIFDRSLFSMADTMVQMKEIAIEESLLPLSLMLVAEWVQRGKQHALQFSGNGFLAHHPVLRYAFYILAVMGIIGLAGTQSEFIYFRF